MRGKIIVAYGQNRVIGNQGKLPSWELSADMKHFKKTRGYLPLIMGSVTYKSLDDRYRPLPDCDNIVLTRNELYMPEPKTERVYISHSLHEAVAIVQKLGYDTYFIIGGGNIFLQALEHPLFVQEIIATEIQGNFEGDTYFPPLDLSEWSRSVVSSVKKDEKNTHDFEIVKYERQVTF